MQKNPITKEVDNINIEEEELKYKSKRKKRTTICKDKKRGYFSCGICGSKDIACQGVFYCENCKKEKEFLIENSVLFYTLKSICDCRENWKFLLIYKIRKCITCGAVETSNCPVCKTSNRYFGHCWTGIFGDKFCKNCGFIKEKALKLKKGELNKCLE